MCCRQKRGRKREQEGEGEGEGTNTHQLQYRQVKWTLLVRAIEIQQEYASLPALSLCLSSDFVEQRKGGCVGEKGRKGGRQRREGDLGS